MDIEKVRYHKSLPQPANDLKESFAWGGFVRYIELGDDGFALRQIDEYKNGYLARYDRDHWEDQFGTLAEVRCGDTWVKHWGESCLIERDEVEQKWNQDAASPAFRLTTIAEQSTALDFAVRVGAMEGAGITIR